MDSNTIGEIAKKEVELDLLKQGFKVARVLGAMNKYDLLIERGDKWQRVKVKMVQRWGDGSTQWSMRKIDKTEVDIYATVDKIMDKISIIKYYEIIPDYLIEYHKTMSDYEIQHIRYKPIPEMDFWRAKQQTMEIWCGDCEYLYQDIDIQKGISFRCRCLGFYGGEGRYLSMETPPKPSPVWCPKRKHNVN